MVLYLADNNRGAAKPTGVADTPVQHRERERQRERQRETERDRQREKDRERDRETEKDRETERQRDRERERPTHIYQVHINTQTIIITGNNNRLSGIN